MGAPSQKIVLSTVPIALRVRHEKEQGRHHGAAGRDFHNFNTYFRNNEKYQVVAFTAAQIPNIEGRCYPATLAGSLYPKGIPIMSEEDLPTIVRKNKVAQVVFAYSDISHMELMHKASWVLSLRADFRLMNNAAITLSSSKPVITVCAVRTGAGKSQTTRKLCRILHDRGLKVVAVRHPMPYGDLAKQAVQRFGEYADLDKHDCTIEEREEYEPLLDNGIVVYAGVDYERILREAEKEADVIVWDGGNNDLPFFESNLHIVIADPHRAGHEISYHPGEVNLRLADVIIINKVQTADRRNILRVKENILKYNPKAMVIEAASPIKVDDPPWSRERGHWCGGRTDVDARGDGVRRGNHRGRGQRRPGHSRSAPLRRRLDKVALRKISSSRADTPGHGLHGRADQRHGGDD